VKPNSIGKPDIYLGAKLSGVRLPNQVEAWAMSPSKYIQEACKNAKQWHKENKPQSIYPNKCSAPFSNKYCPECDITPELEPEEALYFQSIIGVLRWAVGLGRIDITSEVSMLSSHLALPRDGHLSQAFHIFAYLKQRHASCLVFDLTYPEVDETRFNNGCNWKPLHHIPDNAPSPCGKPIVLRLFVDSDHAGDKLKRHSRTGYLICLNNAPIVWFSKKQNTIERSSFGSKFVALKTAMETLRGLRYKLRMLGFAIDGPNYTFGDNMSVVKNTSAPESVLRKKCNSICYHAVRKAVTSGEMIIAHEPGITNPAHILTKAVPGGQQCESLVKSILYNIKVTQSNHWTNEGYFPGLHSPLQVWEKECGFPAKL
jgi:hypothetical protein